MDDRYRSRQHFQEPDPAPPAENNENSAASHNFKVNAVAIGVGIIVAGITVWQVIDRWPKKKDEKEEWYKKWGPPVGAGIIGAVLLGGTAGVRSYNLS